MVAKIFGTDLRNSRRRMNLNQEDLSKLTGLSITSISKYEKGERLPRLSNAKKLAEVLDLDLSNYFLIQYDYNKLKENKSNDSSYPSISSSNYITDLGASFSESQNYHENLETLLGMIMQLNTSGIEKVSQYTADLIYTHKYDYMN